MKTNKSLSKRLRVTGTGKILARKPGFNHFNAKQSRTEQLQGHKENAFPMSKKEKGRFLPN